MITGYFLKSDDHHKGDTKQYNRKYYHNKQQNFTVCLQVMTFYTVTPLLIKYYSCNLLLRHQQLLYTCNLNKTYYLRNF